MPELTGLPVFPVTEPSSILTFSDLLIEVAYKIGVAYYGSDGTQAAQVPIDNHDLDLCQKIVNKGIRMFLADGPGPNGWKFLNPVAQVDIWPIISATSTGVPSFISSTSFNSTTSLTTLTLNISSTVGQQGSTNSNSTAVFYPSMELRNIWLGGNPPPGTPGWQLPVNNPNLSSTSTIGTPFTIVNYLSPTQVQIFGQPASSTFTSTFSGNSTLPGCSWAMIAVGDYTLPADFAGQYTGAITYVQNTNRGMILTWTDEVAIRSRRQNFNFESGTPYECAVRMMPTSSLNSSTPGADNLNFAPPRRRWELMTWRISSEFLHVLFPYRLGFQKLVNLTDVPPSPFAFDECVKAACLAQAEFDVENIKGVAWDYYKTDALRHAYQLDAMAAPKRLGYFGNTTAAVKAGTAIRDFRDNWYQRPTVGVNPTA